MPISQLYWPRHILYSNLTLLPAIPMLTLPDTFPGVCPFAWNAACFHPSLGSFWQMHTHPLKLYSDVTSSRNPSLAAFPPVQFNKQSSITELVTLH